jgi:folylpolyglutamate synthase/dihydropteroate synthase
MGTVEDIRQAIQDFLPPELRTITARLDALDQKFEAMRRENDLRFEAQTSRLEAALARQDNKLDAQNARLEAALAKQDNKLDVALAKQDTKLAIIDGKIQQIIDSLDINRRLQKLEERQAQPAA